MADNDPNDDPLDDGSTHESFMLLFAKDRRRIFEFVYSLVPNTPDAEDIFQQVSMVLWRRFHEFDTNRSFFSWACGVVYLTVQNYRRSRRRQRLIFSDDLVNKLVAEHAEWAKSEPERTEVLEECVSHLKANDRLLLADIYGRGASPTEVATNLGRTVQTIYNRLSAVRKRLLECMNLKLAARQRQGE